MRNKHVGLVLTALVAVLATGRPALPERREKASDRKLTEALRTALQVAEAEGRPFQPEKQTITIQRLGRSWSFRFVRLRLAEAVR